MALPEVPRDLGLVYLSHPPTEVRGQGPPLASNPSPRAASCIFLLYPAQVPGLHSLSHLSRRKRTKATRRATREMQWPR